MPGGAFPPGPLFRAFSPNFSLRLQVVMRDLRFAGCAGSHSPSDAARDFRVVISVHSDTRGFDFIAQVTRGGGERGILGAAFLSDARYLGAPRYPHCPDLLPCLTRHTLVPSTFQYPPSSSKPSQSVSSMVFFPVLGRILASALGR